MSLPGLSLNNNVCTARDETLRKSVRNCQMRLVLYRPPRMASALGGTATWRSTHSISLAHSKPAFTLRSHFCRPKRDLTCGIKVTTHISIKKVYFLELQLHLSLVGGSGDVKEKIKSWSKDPNPKLVTSCHTSIPNCLWNPAHRRLVQKRVIPD